MYVALEGHRASPEIHDDHPRGVGVGHTPDNGYVQHVPKEEREVPANSNGGCDSDGNGDTKTISVTYFI